ncbi:DNA mismatch endonuclease Vsr [Rhizobium sp. NZLR1b]|uniref:very short patch repair endonuclease n=1 Tax=Rhizobium sp. NZLR1b TaxID=2731099 RepID=UPI00287F827A|nr:DNA mismatch endonuclease Vsr [Rhizobium sp. NZLR1b]MBX5172615.1 DNA mismatch endonuclease Vsr [Rhizobium sp. NZLR1b]
MADTLTRNARSALMSRVRQAHTAPEIIVRKALFRSGFRFRLHIKSLPGKPDIVLPRYRTIVFVHGCLWHGHDCRRGKLPRSNVEMWEAKIRKNVERDVKAMEALERSGWFVEVIWECSLDEVDALIERLRQRRPNNPSTRFSASGSA